MSKISVFVAILLVVGLVQLAFAMPPKVGLDELDKVQAEMAKFQEAESLSHVDIPAAVYTRANDHLNHVIGTADVIVMIMEIVGLVVTAKRKQ